MLSIGCKEFFLYALAHESGVYAELVPTHELYLTKCVLYLRDDRLRALAYFTFPDREHFPVSLFKKVTFHFISFYVLREFVPPKFTIALR